MTIISLVISGIALLISVITFFTNKAKHNLQQLQSRYQTFCDKLTALLLFGGYQKLTNFKFDLENVVNYERTDIQSAVDFNKLQKENSMNIEACKMAYLELNENFDFFEFKRALRPANKKIEFIQWFNETINKYYSKLNYHYCMLYDINVIAKTAQRGELIPNAEKIIKEFYKNIREIVDMTEVLLILKREITGAFGKLSVRNIRFFQNSTSAIRKLSRFAQKFIHEYGIDDVINNKDYKKISVVYKEFGEESYMKYLDDEERDFCSFIVNLSQKNAI